MTDEIASRLSQTMSPCSRNRFTVDDIRELALSYLACWDDEISRFPHLTAKLHWDLWMSDAEIERALFVALVFRNDGVEFVCGTGNAYEIKRFAESDFPDDVEQIPSELRRLFSAPTGAIHIPRQDVENWLGRGW